MGRKLVNQCKLTFDTELILSFNMFLSNSNAATKTTKVVSVIPRWTTFLIVDTIFIAHNHS